MNTSSLFYYKIITKFAHSTIILIKIYPIYEQNEKNSAE